MTILLAHISGMPVEELLGPFGSSAVGAGMMALLGVQRALLHIRRRRQPHDSL
ncbi:MAG TPA: hypothetical protein VIX83_13910 [Candidatus Cybelea sp.]